jgi:HPt (histidine-containing phosphotransfer) domain-containing protein
MIDKTPENLVDTEQLNNLKELFNKDFQPFLQKYFSDFEQTEQEMKVAFENNETVVLSKLAHFLKGSSLNMGAPDLANACSKIEVASKQGDLNELKAAYRELEQLYPRTKAEFTRLSQ